VKKSRRFNHVSRLGASGIGTARQKKTASKENFA